MERLLKWYKPKLFITIMLVMIRKIPMNKKHILLVALLSGISLVAMDHPKEMPTRREASRNDEKNLVKIWLTDSENSDTPHEVEIPIRLAQLIGTLNELVEDPKRKNRFFLCQT